MGCEDFLVHGRVSMLIFCLPYALFFNKIGEDVSEVLVCYSLGVYETQSNPRRCFKAVDLLSCTSV